MLTNRRLYHRRTEVAVHIKRRTKITEIVEILQSQFPEITSNKVSRDKACLLEEARLVKLPLEFLERLAYFERLGVQYHITHDEYVYTLGQKRLASSLTQMYGKIRNK